MAVAQAGTLSAAARDLGLPTLNRESIDHASLSRACVCSWCSAARGSACITDAGKEYLHSCKRGLRSLRDAGERMERHRGNPWR